MEPKKSSEHYLASMLRLNQLLLTQFKNYHSESFQFAERIIGISGRNGVGKTNLLDAIHYLCFTKSYFTRVDSNNILQGYKGFRLEGDFELCDKPEKAICILRETGKKEFFINDQAYEKFSEHIGHYPCVIIAPDDIRIITSGGEERRRFIDTLLSQLDATYLQQLIIYNKILQQRNSLLRHFAESGNKNIELLTVIDDQLIKHGEEIFDKRKKFLVSFLPHVKQLYTQISRSEQKGLPEDVINVFFNSELLQASFSELLTINRSKDFSAMRTTSGIHKDDLEFELNGHPFKNIASQGQRKSLLFALKIAEMEVLEVQKGFSPLLLLDDVFEKLDEQRVINLLHWVCLKNQGQIFITDTDKDRIEEHLSALATPYKLFDL